MWPDPERVRSVDPVIAGVEGLTPEWLTATLGCAVREVDVEPIGTGQMGASFRLRLDCPAGPRTLVAKLAAGDPAARARMSTGYAKEVGFYTVLAPTLSVRTPRCWHGAITDDGSEFTLLLDDLAPSTPGVQVEGCSVAHAVGAVRNLAALHASRWNDPSLLAHEFLGAMDAGAAELFGAALVPATEEFVSRYHRDLGEGNVATLRSVADAIVPWLLDRAHPYAVIHGDYRLDNLMFPPRGDGVAALDWQSVSVGPPGRDLAYFIGTTFEDAPRRLHEEVLVGAYHETLIARGVEDYGRDACMEDYRAGHLQGPLITVLGAIYATAGRTESADRMFLAMATRSCAAIRGLGSLDLVSEAR